MDRATQWDSDFGKFFLTENFKDVSEDTLVDYIGKLENLLEEIHNELGFVSSTSDVLREKIRNI